MDIFTLLDVQMSSTISRSVLVLDTLVFGAFAGAFLFAPDLLFTQYGVTQDTASNSLAVGMMKYFGVSMGIHAFMTGHIAIGKKHKPGLMYGSMIFVAFLLLAVYRGYFDETASNTSKLVGQKNVIVNAVLTAVNVFGVVNTSEGDKEKDGKKGK